MIRSVSGLSLCLVALLFACSGETTTDSGEAGSGGAASSAAAEPAISPSERPQLCELITSDAISEITGGTYQSTESQADYNSLAHCDYVGSEDSASLLFASGFAANTRWESAEKSDTQPVEEFLDKACWEPIRGTLSAQTGELFVEVTVSKSHGGESKRIELAKQLGQLLLSKVKA